MQDRKKNILLQIVENYIKIWSPVWSSVLSEKFSVSSATVRKEMSILEKEWMLTTLHTSWWRIPTEKAYKEFLNSINLDSWNLEKNREIARKKFSEIKKIIALKKAKEKISEVIKILSSLTNNIAFATIPKDDKNIFLWLWNFLKDNISENSPEKINEISSVIEVFEWWLISKLNNVEISEIEVKTFIWEENIFPQFESCSMLAIKYNAFW
jgi:heat-inducible transcriptional repressor